MGGASSLAINDLAKIGRIGNIGALQVTFFVLKELHFLVRGSPAPSLGSERVAHYSLSFVVRKFTLSLTKGTMN
ncbi:MAG: hypothetical protein ACRDAM_05120 [Casimicrobium sp.]